MLDGHRRGARPRTVNAHGVGIADECRLTANRVELLATVPPLISNCGEGAQRLRSAGPRTALQATIRAALRGLRCNALLCRHLGLHFFPIGNEHLKVVTAFQFCFVIANIFAQRNH
jgi:hypothetical protein